MFNSGRQQKPVLPVFAPPQAQPTRTGNITRKAADTTLKEFLAVGCVVALLIVGCVMMVHLHALDINTQQHQESSSTHRGIKKRGDGNGRHQLEAIDDVEGDVVLPFYNRGRRRGVPTTAHKDDTATDNRDKKKVHGEVDGDDDLFNQLRKDNDKNDANEKGALEDVANANMAKETTKKDPEVDAGKVVDDIRSARTQRPSNGPPTRQQPSASSSVGARYISRGNLRSFRGGVGVPGREVPPDVPPTIVFPNIYTYPLTLGDRWGKPGGNHTLQEQHNDPPSAAAALLKLYEEYATSTPSNVNLQAVNELFFADMDNGKHSLNPIRLRPSDYVPSASDLQDILGGDGGGDSAEVRQKYAKGDHPSTVFWSSRRPALKELLLRYTAFHNSILSDPEKARRAHYVVVHPVGQLCNRLVAIVSGFVFALLTKRVMLVDDGGFYCSMNDLFDYPGFSWILGETRGKLGGATTAGMIAAQQAINGATGLSEFVIQNPEGGTWSEMEKLLCGDYDRAYSKTASSGRSSTVSFYVNQYVVPYYFRNPHYHSLLAAVLQSTGSRSSGGEALDLFTPVSTFLFRPISKLIQMRDKYIQNNFYDSVVSSTMGESSAVELVPAFVVGLQVRSGGDFTDHFMSEGDWRLYRDCGYQVAPPDVDLPTDLLFGGKGRLVKHISSPLLLGKDGLLDNNNNSAPSGGTLTTDVGGAGDDALRWRGKFTRRFKFFVATDTDKGRQAAAVQLGKGGTKVLFGPTPFMLSNNPEGVQMALLDLLILASCDDRIATAWSSYGYFANGISGMNGNLVTNRAPLTEGGERKISLSDTGVDRVPYWSGIPDQHLQLIHEKVFKNIRGDIDADGGVMVAGRSGGGLDQRTSEQRYMGIMHKSDKRVQCVRLPTHQPCFHKFESWGGSSAKCASWNDTVREEMVLGRYC